MNTDDDLRYYIQTRLHMLHPQVNRVVEVDNQYRPPTTFDGDVWRIPVLAPLPFEPVEEMSPIGLAPLHVDLRCKIWESRNEGRFYVWSGVCDETQELYYFVQK